MTDLDENDTGLILAAEEFPLENFDKYHYFSSHDDIVIRKLSAHGPVLLRGGRGSGKSALLMEAHRRMLRNDAVFSVYMSLRYLPLLQTDGSEYVAHFCQLLSKQIENETRTQDLNVEFSRANSEAELQQSLIELSRNLGKRIVILFDDAAHIGREKPLESFFDLFRSLSSSAVSCKASIYPGVTKFGVRFDVFNDSTVIDVSRSRVHEGDNYFFDVLKLRYPKLAERDNFSDRLTPLKFANLIGRSVVGNMRGFILACNRFADIEKVSVPEMNSRLINMAQDYYWPLMDEVAPKLGVYEPLIETAREIFERLIEHIVKPVDAGSRSIAQDRVIIHRKIYTNFGKEFEILEYLGFFAKREASRGMKSGGRGPVFAINLCSILEQIPSKRLTFEMAEEWMAETSDPSEVHVNGSLLEGIEAPHLDTETALAILQKDISVLGKSSAYPYGLTEDKIDRLKANDINTVKDLTETSDERIQNIYMIGPATVDRIRNVMRQAIWM